ncbi:hypothetical protein ACIBCT_12090 [Streptosporangium sp. NPDC050855]|uniref:hypothetical protein n=1 Tax=Streptosporangium sp. NPDC050855 TaxID=3366194 RepID=UPI00379A03C8
MKHDVEGGSGRSIGVRSLAIIGLRALDDWIFGEIDAFAWVQGWEIDRGRLTSHAYRSPGFDALQRCGLCGGEGRTGARGPARALAAAGADEPAGAVPGGSGAVARQNGRAAVEPAERDGDVCGLCEGDGRIRRLRAGAGLEP